MRPRFTLSGVTILALAAGFALAAGAEEEAPPAERFIQHAEAVPAPDVANGIDFDADLVLNGTPMGTVKMKAEPGVGAAGPLWTIEESFELAGGAMRRESHALMDAALRPLEGSIRGQEPGSGPFEVEWKRVEGGFEAVRRWQVDGEAHAETTTWAQSGRTMTTMTSLWLFCRMRLAGDDGGTGSYEVLVFDADPDEGEGAFEAATWTFTGPAEWNGTPALRVEGRKGDDGLEGFFDPGTKAFLGGRLTNTARGMTMEMRPRSEPSAAPGAAGDPFASPALSARSAALQAALGFGTGDVDLLAKVIHWPSVHEVLAARYDAQHVGSEGVEPFPDVATLRAGLLKQWRQGLPKRPRPMIEGVLKALQDQLEVVEQGDGRVLVTFPALFQGLKLVVGEVDEAWYLVELPEEG